VEWAERAKEIMPAERLWIRLRIMGENERAIVLEAQGRRYEELLAEVRG